MNPRLITNFLDTCAFDPKYSPEHEAAKEIRNLGDDGSVILVLTHSNQKEIDHPNTPSEVKVAAKGMLFTLPVTLTPDEVTRKTAVHSILVGDGKAEKYAADADHVFNAGRHSGYFITTDERILRKRIELHKACHASVIRPSEWLQLFMDT